MSGRRGSTTPSVGSSGRPESPTSSASGRKSPHLRDRLWNRRGSAQSDVGDDSWGLESGLSGFRRPSIAAVLTSTPETDQDASGDRPQSPQCQTASGSRPSSPLLGKFGSALSRMRTTSPDQKGRNARRFGFSRAKTAPESTTQEPEADEEEGGEGEEGGDAEEGEHGKKKVMALSEEEIYARSHGMWEMRLHEEAVPGEGTPQGEEPDNDEYDEDIRARTMEDGVTEQPRGWAS